MTYNFIIKDIKHILSIILLDFSIISFADYQ